MIVTFLLYSSIKSVIWRWMLPPFSVTSQPFICSGTGYFASLKRSSEASNNSGHHSAFWIDFPLPLWICGLERMEEMCWVCATTCQLSVSSSEHPGDCAIAAEMFRLARYTTKISGAGEGNSPWWKILPSEWCLRHRRPLGRRLSLDSLRLVDSSSILICG